MRALDPQSLTQHVDRLYRAAWALCGSREDAEDLVQETFARVLSRPRVLHGDDELHYLMRVLRNTFLTGRRTAGRRPVTSATLDDVVAADPNVMGRPDQAMEMQELYATIASLPDDFRFALVAVDVLGLSYREAARALRVREGTITTRLFRARKQVAERLLPEAHPSSEDSRARQEAAGSRATAAEPRPGHVHGHPAPSDGPRGTASETTGATKAASAGADRSGVPGGPGGESPGGREESPREAGKRVVPGGVLNIGELHD
ncbi:MAG TPA: RNA polymerase sigma factor [Acidimicrobiales bacterium]|nr:RNA polymerase sigma factor [Acidimicrobiales bacterium]